MPCDTNRPAGSARWPLSRVGFCGGLGMVNSAGVGNFRRIAHHPPADRHCPTHRPLFLFQDGKEGAGGEVPPIARLDRLATGFSGARFPLAIGSPVVQFGHLPGLLVLPCFHLFALEEELIFRVDARWIGRHGGEFRRHYGMFGNGQSFGDWEVT